MLWLSTVLVAQVVGASSDIGYEALAKKYAPIVYQELGPIPKADIITRIDFDGDWVANNNWRNLELFRPAAHLYYEVYETQSHHLIFYAIYHPRDYSKICVPAICHENDLEGLVVVVSKNGNIHALQTLAHNSIYTYLSPKTQISSEGEHVSIFVEWGGHGIYGFDADTGEKLETDSLGRTVPFVESLTNDSILDLFSRGNFITYKIGENAETSDQHLLETSLAPNVLVHYKLLSIRSEMWLQRESVGRGKLFDQLFEYRGSRLYLGNIPNAFAGEKFWKGSAKPPWAWEDTSRDDVKKGDWFVDPALFFRRTMVKAFNETGFASKIFKNFSTIYITHPYLSTRQLRAHWKSPGWESRMSDFRPGTKQTFDETSPYLSLTDPCYDEHPCQL